MNIPQIFDARLRAVRRYRQEPEAFLIRQLALRALERIEALTTAPRAIAILGTPSPSFIGDLFALFPDSEIQPLLMTDDERITAAPCDLIIDLGQLALVNDVPGVMIQLRQALNAGGKFVSLIYGGNSLGALRRALLQAETELTGGAAPRIHPGLSLDSAIALLQRAGFTSPVADHEPLAVTYPSVAALAQDLRAAGLGNALSAQSRRLPPRQLFTRAEAIWRGDQARLAATFEIVSLTGWRD